MLLKRTCSLAARRAGRASSTNQPTMFDSAVASLTQAEIEQYHRDGYVVPSSYRLPPEVLQKIKDDHARLIESSPEFTDYCPALLCAELGFLNYARDPNIVNMVSQVIGKDIALWNSSFFAKPPHVGRKVPFHQDGQYWCMRPLATCTVWIAVDRSHPGNGCLKVIKGSHKDRTLKEHLTHNDPDNMALQQETDPSEFDASAAVDLVLEPGQISLHDAFLVHGSDRNTSCEPRRGMTLRYMPTTSAYERNLGAEYAVVAKNPVFLISGVDRSNRTDFGLLRRSLL
jgi:hypothetical protein